MKNRILYFLFLLFLLVPFNKLKSEESNSRKGFFLSFAPGFGPEVIEYKVIGAAAQIRIGAGITERTLLYGEGSLFYTLDHDINYFVGDFQPKVQHFVYEQLYVNYGFGLSIGNLNSTAAASRIRAGFMTSAGIGYEFRSEKKFRIAPEMGLYYRRMGGVNYFVPTAMANLIWYF